MLCVSIAQQSQRLAVFDMFNAGQLADLIELQLDRFDKAPDFGALFEKKFKPVIVSCRRPNDGGFWEGAEDARLAVLRQAVLAQADYVEIELDVASQIRRYGSTKRIISYTNTQEVPNDLAEIYRDCAAADPDVIKITVPTRTPDEAWPLIKIVAKASIPTVAVGWGRSGRLLSVLGQRYKAPWTYAALERGMEAYPGMATVAELEDAYDIHNVNSKTPLLGIAGGVEEQALYARILNHGFRLAHEAEPENKAGRTRCLPLELGDLPLFQKVVDAIKLAGVLVDDARQQEVLSILHEPEESVRQAGACDFVAIRDDKWKGFLAMPRAVVGAIEDAMLARRPDEPALAGRTFIVVGHSGLARGIASSLRRKNAAVVIADSNNERAKQIAAEVGGRYVPNGQVYTAMCDGMILTRALDSQSPGVAAIPMPTSAVREGLVAVDLTWVPWLTPFLDEARVRGGLPIAPSEILLRTAQLVLKAYTGQSFSLDGLKSVFDGFSDELAEVRRPPAP